MKKALSGIKFKCHWDERRVCERELMCDGCKHQPPDDEKENGAAPPRPVKWTSITGDDLYPECPACGEIPYSTERCSFCGQRFVMDERLTEYSKPPEEVRMNCFVCGGEGTLVGSRARSNGHFHGQCEACGCVVME